MKNQINTILLLLIFILAFFLRFWHLGSNPPSLDWDEASLGYNAYSILKSGADEYGNFLPLSIRSFNDYKPPLYTYLTIVPVSIFGLNEFSVRFVSAFLGTLSIVVSYFLVKELFPKKSFIFYLLSFIFIAVSPWHIQFSRVAFEANIAQFFFILGVLLFLKGGKLGHFYFLSFISLTLSIYSYHSPRLVIPILLLGLIFIYRKEIKENLWWFSASFILFFILMFPILNQMRAGTARFSSVTVVNPDERLGGSIEAIELDQERGDLFGKLMHNRRVVYTREILAGYLDHFNFDFLFLNGDPPGRHHAVGMGMLYLWDLPFIILGVLGIIREIRAIRGNRVLIWWFLVAPVASALTTGTPHAVRALLYIPTYQILIVFGVIRFIKGVIRFPFVTSGLLRMTLSVVFLLFIFNFYYYLHMYYVHTPNEYSQWWQYGYKEAVKEVTKIEKDYDKVIVTYVYDQPYIFFLFYIPIDPSWYQQNWGDGEIKRAERTFGKYVFHNIDWMKDSQQKNTLLVGTGEEIPGNFPGIIKEIYFLDGSVAFRIAKT